MTREDRAPAARILVLGDDIGLVRAVRRRLESRGITAPSAVGCSDSEIAAALAEGGWRATAVITRDDALALRLTLLCAHLCPDLPLWVTMFDRTVARELDDIAPMVHVVSASDIVARALADECERAAVLPIARGWAGVRLVDDALRLLCWAGLALLLALLFETGLTMVALDHGIVEGLFFSTRSVVTVAGTPGSAHGPDWYQLLSVANMVVALLGVAVFTAALVRRLSRRRLTTLLGSRAAPARGHVLLVGFGQVGLRLAQRLRERRIPVLAVERDAAAPCLRLARASGIPVAIGRGDDRETLRRLGIRHSAAVAAVTSDDLVNVAVGLAAIDLMPRLPIVLRLGDGEVAAETDSLLHLGHVCDAHGIAADTIADMVCDGLRLTTN